MQFSDLAETSRLIRKEKAGSLPVLAPAGVLRIKELIGQAAWPAFIFAFVLLMRIQPFHFDYALATLVVTVIGAVALMAWPTLAVYLYFYGTWKVVSKSVARSSSVLFWLYWPFWRFVLCLVALALAYDLGDQLWFGHFQLYEEYYRLQAYDNVDSNRITGTRLQDAGIVRFNTTDGVDRARAGCIVNGRTYCVAPIISGGVVKPGVAQSSTGVQDLFMAGVDCCNCPVTDFRCGDWDETSGNLGGMRLFNAENNKMFRLAAEKFGANYDKVMVNGVFFQWANNPLIAWAELYSRGAHLAALYLIFAVFGSFFIMVVLNGFMKLLTVYQVAAPINEHPPAIPGLHHGFGSPVRDFIPKEYQSYLDQQEPLRASNEQDPHFVVL